MAELSLLTVLKKTDAGLTAFKNRDRAITQQARALMILLDGVKPVQEVIKFAPDLGTGLRLLGELLAADFVSVVGSVAAAPPPVAAASSNSASLLKASMRRATVLLANTLGPASDQLAMQMERCKTMDELSAKIGDAARMVGALRSAKAAEEFYRAATAPI